MIKSELVESLAQKNPHLYQRDVEVIVNAILNTITEALAKGDRVEIRGFGSFSTRSRSGGKRRNPRTGETVTVGEKKAAHFKPGKEMLENINGGKVPGRNRKR